MKKIFYAFAFVILILGFFYFHVNNISFDQSKIKNLKVSDETNQIVFVLANKFGKAKLFFCEKNDEGEWNEKINSYAFVGKAGIGQASEGSMKTPKGAYNFTHAFGISENPGIKSFDYVKVDKDYYWVDDVNSAYYNKFVCTKDKNIVKDWNSAEHIIDYPEAYKYVLAFDYNKECVRHVMDNSYDPKKQEINFSYVDGNFSPIKEAYKTIFSSKEYIVGNLEQIFPFINIKIQRNEYCVIWRDPNFSETPVYNDNYDKIFKKFLKQRKDYVEQYAKFNIYPCIDSDEALELVKKKKYNKIILMSNVGTDFGGKKFVDKARLIIGNDVIALFLAYKIEHITWIKDYKNALFSNDSSFYEQYLECFTNDEETTKQNILTLKNSIQDFYKVKFNFDDKFLEYPSFIEFGKYSELSF